MSLIRWSLVAAVSLLPSLAARAQPGPISVESLELETLLDLDVEAATKTTQPLSQSPAVGAVLVREQVEDFGWNSLNDVLYSQPGFFPSQDYERRTVGARGEAEAWNNNRLLLLIDGMPHNDVETGSALTWEITPLFLLHRVEVLRGPGSALYGSYALNGVVAVDTISARDLGDRRALARFRYGVGSYMLDVLGAQPTSLADVVVAFNLYATRGDESVDFDGSGRTDDTGELARFPVQDRQSSHYFFFKAEAKGVLSGLQLSFHAQDWTYGTGRGWLFFTPDGHESMKESRQIVSLRYQSPGKGPWSQEYALQLQRHGYDLDVRLYPSGAFDGFYPGGVNERVETAMTSLFGRAQVTRSFEDGASVLFGAEYSGLVYDGDRVHTADADITSEEAAPFEADRTLPSIYEPIQDHLVSKLGLFTQLSSGRALGDRFTLTAGLRYDVLFFRYDDVAAEGRPVRSRAFQELSPRLALIYQLAPPLTLKLMAARSFRTPTPVELFASSTLTAGSTNISEIKPERQDTYEIALDLRAASWLQVRTNAWFSSLANDIGYDASNSVIVNRYDNERLGWETELLFDARPAAGLQLDGWASYSFVHLLGQTITDPGLAASDHLTGAPAHLLKAGARLRAKRWTLALQGMWQGEVERRENEMATPLYRDQRPDTILPWIVLDASIHYRPLDWMRLGLNGKNLFDSRGRVAAPLDAPFDYHVDGRRVMMELELSL